jgi:hypothetical protein
MAIRLHADEQRRKVRFPAGARDFSFQQRSDPLWGPPSIVPDGYGKAIPETGREGP